MGGFFLIGYIIVHNVLVNITQGSISINVDKIKGKGLVSLGNKNNYM